MAIELHHLNTHGMMEQACDVLDGVVRLKARIAELESTIDKEKSWSETLSKNGVTMSHEIERLKVENERMKARIAELERMDTEHTLQIAKMNGYISHLEEERRWRKFSEEKPEDEGDYLVMARYPDDNEQHIEICLYDRNCEDFGHYERRYSGSGNSFGGFCGEEWVTHNVTFWRPLPSAPKEEMNA